MTCQLCGGESDGRQMCSQCEDGINRHAEMEVQWMDEGREE